MNNKALPCHTLKELFRADPYSGILYWLERSPAMFRNGAHSAEHSCAIWNSRFSGKQALTALNGNGYMHGDIFGKKYRAHRVMWALCYGAWPDHQIDHIDGNRSNNSLRNLRQATASENLCNRGAQKNNKSGLKGAYWHKASNLWRSTIVVNGIQKSLGYFSTADAAHSAYCNAASKYHGNYANTGVNNE